MASPSAAPWPAPSRSVHPAAVDSGANHSPASPAALTITAAAISTRWLPARWARTGASSAVPAPPRFIKASRKPACTAPAPRSRNMIGSHESAV